jgi:hypothetical protein
MRGGRRPGAGRKAGIPNKRTLELHALAEGQPQPGTPLEFLMGVYCNEALPIELCIDAASKAAPYVHPRLTAGTLAGDTQYPLRAITRIALVPVRPQPRDNLP